MNTVSPGGPASNSSRPDRSGGLGERRRATVAQLIGSFDGGGAQRAAMNLARGLASSGCRSLAVALRSEGSFASVREAGLETHSVNARRGLGALPAAFRLRRLLRSQRVDVLHVHGSSCLLIAALALIGLASPRLYFTWHDSGNVLEQAGLRRWATRAALDRCTAVFGSSADVAARLSAAWGRRKPVSVLHNGVPVSGAIRRGRPDHIVVLWLARFVPDKDAAILVRAAAELLTTGLDLELVLAGGPTARHQWYFDQIRALVDQLGLAHRVVLPGWIRDTDALLASADVAVQTSRTEGLSMALLEQMMAGLAIVATDVGETRYALDDGRSGLLIPPDDEAALIRALRRLVVDPDERARLGDLARSRATALFSLEAMAARALCAYGLGPRA